MRRLFGKGRGDILSRMKSLPPPHRPRHWSGESRLWLCLLIAALAVGCAPTLQRRQWKAAEAADRVDAYERFLTSFPEGKLAEKARLRMDALIDTVRRIRSVRIAVTQTYASRPSSSDLDGFQLPFEDLARELLQYVDVDVVGADSQDFDSALEITSEGEALKLSYVIPNDRGMIATTSPQQRQFAGAHLEGTISWRPADRSVYETTFLADLPPPDRIPSFQYDSPRDAPFLAAFEQSFLPAMARMMGTVHGTHPLIGALREGRHVIRTSVATALGEIGNPDAVGPLADALKEDTGISVREQAATALGQIGDPRAVEPLIQALENQFDHQVRGRAAEALGKIADPRAIEPLIEAVTNDAYPVRLRAAEALRAISNRYFGTHGEKWKAWWAGAKGDYGAERELPD